MYAFSRLAGMNARTRQQRPLKQASGSPLQRALSRVWWL